MLGAWRSRFYSFTQQQFQQLVLEYHAQKFPLDVMVMDMGWHTTPHWGSMDWDKKLIPDPTQMLQWMHAHHLRVTLNWHPQDGIGPWDKQYPAFAEAIGVDPKTQKVIPFEDTNEKFMHAYYKLFMDPLEKQGVDFWWLDDGGKFLAWDNAMDFWNIGRPGTGRRGASFSRWGGWGGQRYPVFFSGDTSSLWRTLRFEVPFTATGGNVGADYWSNDLAGFRLKIPSSELFTRWVEFGALSPVFRTHGEIDFGNYRLPWAYGRRSENATRKAYDLRDELFPYIYTSAYLTWKTSMPLARPLYLGFPDQQEAYTHRYEYEFGPDILVAPIVTRGIGKAWLGATEMWFPGGEWWNLSTGERVNEPGNHTVLATADEIPVFVRGGAPLPLQTVQPHMALAPPDPLVVRAYPGPDGEFTMYEDDGTSPAYLKGGYSLTPLHYANRSGEGVRVTVGPTTGSYNRQLSERRIMIELPDTTHPATVTANGLNVPESTKGVLGYSYDPVRALTEIRLPEEPIRKQVIIDVSYKGSQAVQSMVPEIVNRIARVHRALAGAGQVRAKWKFDLVLLQLNLQTVLSEAEQAFGSTDVNEVRIQLTATTRGRAKIVSLLEDYTNQQARAAAFALGDAYLNGSVRLRKAGEGLMVHGIPRLRKTYGRPNDIRGYKRGILVRALVPASAGTRTLAIDIPSVVNTSFVLPQGKGANYIFLPFAKATQHPLYHLLGTLSLTTNNSRPLSALTRRIDVRHDLLTQWKITGPFNRGMAPAIGKKPVTAATLRVTYTGKDGKPVSWVTWQAATRKQKYRRGSDYLQAMQRWIDLNTIFPQRDAEAVAVTWVEAPKPIAVDLNVRHDAGIQVWVNEQNVIGSSRTEGTTDLTDPPPDTVVVKLKKGWNQISVTSDSGKEDWGFALRLSLPPGVICAQSDGPPSPAA